MKNFILLLTCLAFTISTTYADDLTIRESTDNGMVLEFSLQKLTHQQLTIQNRSYISLQFENSETFSKPGEPQIPCRTVLIGIPLSARVSYQITDMEYGEKINGTILPTPDLSSEYIENPVYYQDATVFPAEIIVIEKPGFLRNQRAVLMKIFPIQYFPQPQQIQIINKMTISISFNQTKELRPITPNAISNDSFYDTAILNYEMAKNWQQPPKRQSLQKQIFSHSQNWYKIFTKKEGIYRITGSMLSDYGISITAINPNTIQIFNNGGRELPRALYTTRSDSLMENAILVYDLDNNNIFDESDYILFYAKSVQGWTYDVSTKTYTHYINHYTYENIYWLTWGNRQGKRMATVALPQTEQMPMLTSFHDHVIFEEDLYNLLDSGIDWYGKAFSYNGSSYDNKTITFNLKGAIPQDSVLAKIRVAGVSSGEHRFNFYLNNQFLGNLNFYGFSSKYVSLSTKEFSHATNNILIDGYNEIRLQYQLLYNISEAYLDWIELHFGRRLIAIDNELLFYSPQQPGNYRYQVSGFEKDEISVYDITDFDNVRQFDNLTIADGAATFADTVNSSSPKRYFALTTNNYQAPLRIVTDVTSNLRASVEGVDFIIITHDDFYDQVFPLKSLRENCDNLKTQVVKISDIYDEFSWGLFDPVAIRDFVKFAFENWVIQPKYVLLFGSGDFDYRNILDPIDHNYIPPYQTTETYEGDSRAWDDFYVCVNGDDNFLDLSLGRLPARSPDCASNIVQKIINYQNTPLFGDWRNTIVMVADDLIGEDEDFIEREHTIEAELISEEYIQNSFNIKKIYLIEYPGIYTASITGTRKPAAQQDIIDAINNGCLIINYIGHGRYDLWAHEVVLMMDQDLQRINNSRKQAFWIAGTCYFGRFDNPDYESMTEELLIMKDNGAIGVLAAARLVSSGPNTDFNKKFYTKLFPSAYHKVRLGDAVSSTKNSRGNTDNDQKLILFGDPTMFLANPSYKAAITQIIPDTIKALSRLKLKGEVQKDGLLWPNFNGQILLKAFDSKKFRSYQIAEDDVIDYWLQGNTIFRGTATVENGLFEMDFIVPKDITYGGQNGRFSLYYWNDEVDGSGFQDLIPVGGTEINLHDFEGPRIALFSNGDNFYDGGFTNTNSLLTIEISDSLSGINIAGDIGHGITLKIDDEKLNVTDLFNYYNDNFLAGSFDYQLNDLSEGFHSLTIKAWDNSNNSSEATMNFSIVADDGLALRNVMNYPNPFSRQTEFTFWTNQECEATIKIYTVAGRLIKKINPFYAYNGFNHIPWDGIDEDGNPIANGIYLYKVFAKSNSEGKTSSAEAIEKLMIMR